MQVHEFLLQFLIILVSARALGELVSLFGAPSVIGELLAGIIIGPSVFGWVEVNDIVIVLSEIGVIMLLFEVGLDSDFDKLLKSGTKSVVVAVGGFIAPMIVGYATAHYIFELTVYTSLFVGGTLTATSIGVTVRTLTDVHKQASVEGNITLGAAVLDDIFGVILLALLYELVVSGDVSLVNASKVFGFVTVFFLLAPILAKLMSQFIITFDRYIDNPGLIPVTVFALVLFMAWLAHWVGAPQLLGGFAAGIALSRRFFLPFGLALKSGEAFTVQIENQLRPIVQIFTPIFFVTVGLSMNLSSVEWSSPYFWWFSLSIVAIAIATKFTGALLINESFPRRFVIGMTMVPRGEVGLIFAGLGVTAGVFDNDTYTALVMVIAYTTLLSPFWIKLYYRKFGHLVEDENPP